MRYMWHATSFDNLISILDKGLIPGKDEVVYMTERDMDALKFLFVRGCKHILNIKIKLYKKDEKNIIETFDHSEKFFKCRAYGHIGNIAPDRLIEFREYNMEG